MDATSKRNSGEDISATMMRRAKALHRARYSVDAGANLDVLRDEKKASAIGSSSQDPIPSMIPRTKSSYECGDG